MNYIIGIDLHGTLLNGDERIDSAAESRLIFLLKNRPKNMKLYICTGNDLTFVERKLGDHLYLFDGSVLETGAVISRDNRSEEVISNKDDINRFKQLEMKLLGYNFPELYKSARRLTSISLFVNRGESVESFYNKVVDIVGKESDFYRVTYSSVAVDIVPKDFDKLIGLKSLGKDDDLFVGIADSLNDLELLNRCDLSFVPSNYNSGLDKIVDRDVLPISQFRSDAMMVASSETSAGVAEILELIFEKFGK